MTILLFYYFMRLSRCSLIVDDMTIQTISQWFAVYFKHGVNVHLLLLYNKVADSCPWVLLKPWRHANKLQGEKTWNVLNSLFKCCYYINHSIENLINWTIKETWKLNCTPVQTAVWFNGCTIHPVFELAAYSIHTKPGYYPADWLVSLLFSLVLVHWYRS